jgi:hypothetical protein
MGVGVADTGPNKVDDPLLEGYHRRLGCLLLNIAFDVPRALVVQVLRAGLNESGRFERPPLQSLQDREESGLGLVGRAGIERFLKVREAQSALEKLVGGMLELGLSAGSGGGRRHVL